jgi:Pectate lyase superfamily protein/PKD domain
MSPLSRRDFLRYQAVLGAAALTPFGVRALLQDQRPKHDAQGGKQVTAAATQVYNVNDYGAYPDGTDATPGFRRAITAAQDNPAGGTVMIPAGMYYFTSRVAGEFSASIEVHRAGRPIIVSGPTVPSGQPPLVTLVQQVPDQTLISVHTDGTTVQYLTLDCQSYQGGICFGVGSVVVGGTLVGGNDTTLQYCTALGSSAAKAFTLSYRRPPTATEAKPVYGVGNRIISCNVNDEIADDGISFSFQQNGLIQDIKHFGSRLSLFMCSNVTVEDYEYTPNPYCNDQDSPEGVVTNGYWITPPSDNITITNFTTSGEGGVISGPIQARLAENITINNQQMTNTDPSKGYQLGVGNVDGLTINGGSFKGNTVVFFPGTPSKESPASSADLLSPVPSGPLLLGATGVVVEDAVIGSVEVKTSPDYPAGDKLQNDGPPIVDATFQDCTFVSLGAGIPTFSNLSPFEPRKGWSFTGPANFTITGGAFQNAVGEFYANKAAGPIRKIKKCDVDGTTVKAEVPHSRTLAVGQTVHVEGLGAITVPDGDYIVTADDQIHHTITFDCASATGKHTIKHHGHVRGLNNPPVLSVSGCTVSGTTVTLTLNSSAVLAVGETIEVSGITGFTANAPNGTFVITGRPLDSNTITYTVSTSPAGTYENGGTVTGSQAYFTVSGLAPIAPVSNFPPAISGTLTVGSTLTASEGTWVPQQGATQTYAYQWYLNDAPVAGATSATHTPKQAGSVRVSVTATNATGSTTVTSAPVNVTGS